MPSAAILVFLVYITGVQGLFRLSLGHRRLADATYNEQRLGSSTVSHYAQLYLGMPPQATTVIVDTGSSLTAVDCTSCPTCKNKKPPYSPLASTTASNISCLNYTGRCDACVSKQCNVQQHYADGSNFEAFMVKELAYIGKMNATTSSSDLVQANGVYMSIGCQTKLAGHFTTQPEDGILGMQQDSSTILSAMVRDGRVDKNAFSLCLTPTGGTFVLGGNDQLLHEEKIKYVPMVRPASNKYYSVDVVDIFIGNTSLGLDKSAYIGFGTEGRSFILDSGSTVSELPAAVYDKLVDVLQQVAKVSKDGSAMTPAIFAKLPNFQLVLRGHNNERVTLSYSPAQYFIPLSNSKYVFGFSRSWGTTGGVLGANMMMNYDIHFDIENQRVGFARANCTRTKETDTTLMRKINATAAPQATRNESLPSSSGGKSVSWAMMTCMVGLIII